MSAYGDCSSVGSSIGLWCRMSRVRVPSIAPFISETCTEREKTKRVHAMFRNEKSVINALEFAGMSPTYFHPSNYNDDDISVASMVYNALHNVVDCEIPCSPAHLTAKIEQGAICAADTKLLRTKFSGFFQGTEYHKIKAKYKNIKFQNPDVICDAFNKSIPGNQFPFIKNPLFFFVFADDNLKNGLNIDTKFLAELSKKFDNADINTLCKIPEICYYWICTVIRTHKSQDELWEIRDTQRRAMNLLKKHDAQLRDKDKIIAKKNQIRYRDYGVTKQVANDFMANPKKISDKAENSCRLYKMQKVHVEYQKLFDQLNEYGPKRFAPEMMRLKKQIEKLKINLDKEQDKKIYESFDKTFRTLKPCGYLKYLCTAVKRYDYKYACDGVFSISYYECAVTGDEMYELYDKQEINICKTNCIECPHSDVSEWFEANRRRVR